MEKYSQRKYHRYYKSVIRLEPETIDKKDILEQHIADPGTLIRTKKELEEMKLAKERKNGEKDC